MAAERDQLLMLQDELRRENQQAVSTDCVVAMVAARNAADERASELEQELQNARTELLSAKVAGNQLFTHVSTQLSTSSSRAAVDELQEALSKARTELADSKVHAQAVEGTLCDALASCSGRFLDGTWSGAVIRGGHLFHHNGQAHAKGSFRYTGDTSVELVNAGIAIRGQLQADGKLHWTNGDIWQRLGQDCPEYVNLVDEDPLDPAPCALASDDRACLVDMQVVEHVGTASSRATE
jgi:hypothetical protein